MDTREKIISADSAAGILEARRPIRLVIGHFDPVHSVHAKRLRSLRGNGITVVVVTDGPAPLSTNRARAEVVAGLKPVDYVIASEGIDVEQLIATLHPEEVIREQEADVQRTADLIAHVHARQTAK